MQDQEIMSPSEGGGVGATGKLWQGRRGEKSRRIKQRKDPAAKNNGLEKRERGGAKQRKWWSSTMRARPANLLIYLTRKQVTARKERKEPLQCTGGAGLTQAGGKSWGATTKNGRSEKNHQEGDWPEGGAGGETKQGASRKQALKENGYMWPPDNVQDPAV